jgi:hypothetical protein
MGEAQSFFLKVGIAFGAALILSGLNFWLAERKGRDTIGWFLNGFFPSLVGFLIVVLAFPGRLGWILAGGVLAIAGLVALLLLPGRETPGQTKRCPQCGKLAAWKAVLCPACGTGLQVSGKEPAVKIKRPLRTFYLFFFLFVLLLLIVFGFIGYFCVPNQPGG